MESDNSPVRGARLLVDISRQTSAAFTLSVKFEAVAGFTMVLGPSGCGKTTLLECIAGFARPDEGRIAIGERILFDASSHIDVPVASRRLGYLFQSLALFPHLTVRDNVQYGIVKLPAAERERRMMSLLESFRIPHLRDRYPNQISGGERQRVALARSLVTDPGLLLLDEPLTALDAAAKADLLDDLREWNAAHQIPILYVTHAPEEAFALGERVIVIDGGRLIAEGLPQDVLKSPRSETIAQIVGFENVLDASVVSIHEAEGTMICRLHGSDLELEVPLTANVVGASVRIAIRAGDIMIATERLRGLSARNTFPGRIATLRRIGVSVVATVDCGVMFEVHLTPGAADELQLAAGGAVWLVLKTYSCSIVAR